MFGSMGDMLKLMGQAGKIKEQLARMQEKAKRRSVEGEAGGGLVKVTVNGAGEVLAVQLDPEVLSDPETIGPLVTAAANVALKKSKELLLEETQKSFGDLGIELPPGVLNT